MIINISDTQKLKRVVIEFDDNEVETIETSPKKLSKKTVKPERIESVQEDTIDFSSYETTTNISREVVEQPKIPERTTSDTSVADTMQNLEI